MKTMMTAVTNRLGRRTRRAATVAVVALALGVVALGQAPDASAAVTATTGAPGVFRVVDTADSSAANCIYQQFVDAQHPNGRRLSGIHVKAPVMYARDRTAGVDSQEVWYVATLVRVETNGAETVVVKGSVMKGTATERTPANLTLTAFDMTGRPEGLYRIVLDMSWRQPGNTNGTPEGTVKYVFGYYDQSRQLSNGGNTREWYQLSGCMKTFTY